MSRCLSAPEATSLHHCLQNKQLKHSVVRVQKNEYLVLCTVEEGVAKKGDGIYLTNPFCKAGYRPVSVQCLNSIQDSKILTMVLEAVM